MFCTSCGAQLKDGAKFCVNCGTPVAAAPNSVEEPIITPAPVEESAPEIQQSVPKAQDYEPKAQDFNAQEHIFAGEDAAFAQPEPAKEAVPEPPAVSPAPKYEQPRYSPPVYQQPNSQYQRQNTYTAATYAPEAAQGSVAVPIMALIFGILSIAFCWVPVLDFILALLSVIFGGIGLKKRLKGMAIAGLVIGIIFMIVSVIWTISFFVGLSYVDSYYSYSLWDILDELSYGF